MKRRVPRQEWNCSLTIANKKSNATSLCSPFLVCLQLESASCICKSVSTFDVPYFTLFLSLVVWIRRSHTSLNHLVQMFLMQWNDTDDVMMMMMSLVSSPFDDQFGVLAVELCCTKCDPKVVLLLRKWLWFCPSPLFLPYFNFIYSLFNGSYPTLITFALFP